MTTPADATTMTGAAAQRALGRTLSDAIDHAVDRWSGLDPAAAALRGAIAPVLGGRAPRGLRDAVNGTWLGHPLHPLLVTVPIGAWTLTALFDLAGQEEAADLCVAAGVAGAGAAAVTGLAQWDTAADQPRPRRVGLLHSSLNTVATAGYVASGILRARGQRGAGIAASTAGYAVMMASGWLGGHLSYTLGVGVEDDAVARRQGAAPAGVAGTTAAATTVD